MKPLLSPPRRRRDRRGSVATERLRYALGTATGARVGWRASGDKRRALRRLLGRRTSPPAWLGSVLFLVAVASVLAASWRLATEARELVPFESASADYTALVEATRVSCESGAGCGFGRGGSLRPPRAVRDAMVRVSARSVHHDALAGRTVFRAHPEAPWHLVHAAPPTAPQAAFRKFEDARLDAWRRQADRPAPPTYDLGAGWSRVGR